jgi:hypothetical protein
MMHCHTIVKFDVELKRKERIKKWHSN